MAKRSVSNIMLNDHMFKITEAMRWKFWVLFDETTKGIFWAHLIKVEDYHALSINYFEGVPIFRLIKLRHLYPYHTFRLNSCSPQIEAKLLSLSLKDELIELSENRNSKKLPKSFLKGVQQVLNFMVEDAEVEINIGWEWVFNLLLNDLILLKELGNRNKTKVEALK